MQLPVKEYFSLREISNLWSVTYEDLLYYAENNLLEICARSTAIIVEIGQTNYENMILGTTYEGEGLRFSPQPLLSTDIYRIIKAGENPIMVFQTKNNNVSKLSKLIKERGISLSIHDLVVTRKEKIRFEQTNGINNEQLTYRAFTFSPDFREVWHYGKRHLFGSVQAKIVSQLYFMPAKPINLGYMPKHCYLRPVLSAYVFRRFFMATDHGKKYPTRIVKGIID